MSRSRLVSIFVVAAVALATGFLVAGQAKVQLLTPSNQLARYQALVRSVQELEAANAESRRKIAALRSQIDALEAAAAQRSATTQALQSKVGDLRARAGLTRLHGPGVEVNLANGVPGPDTGAEAGYLGIPIDQQYGGSGGDILDMVIVVEELAKKSASIALTFMMSSCFGAKALAFAGNERQKQENEGVGVEEHQSFRERAGKPNHTSRRSTSRGYEG